MQRFTYSKPGRNLGQFCDELIAAIPALLRTEADGTRTALFQVDDGGQADGIRAFVPDNVSKVTVDAVVAAHTPDATYGVDQPFNAAATALRNLWQTKLSAQPPTALTATEQSTFNKAVLVVIRRLARELQ